jgi:hypothetical protein
MEAVDLTVMEELLAPDARWGAPEQDVPACRNAKEILAWYEMARDNGIRADITETVVIRDNILVGLKVIATGDVKSKPVTRWQVLKVENGLVTELRGYERRGDATEQAESGISNWSN